MCEIQKCAPCMCALCGRYLWAPQIYFWAKLLEAWQELAHNFRLYPSWCCTQAIPSDATSPVTISASIVQATPTPEICSTSGGGWTSPIFTGTSGSSSAGSGKVTGGGSSGGGGGGNSSTGGWLGASAPTPSLGKAVPDAGGWGKLESWTITKGADPYYD